MNTDNTNKRPLESTRKRWTLIVEALYLMDKFPASSEEEQFAYDAARKSLGKSLSKYEQELGPEMERLRNNIIDVYKKREYTREGKLL